ncbi:MAG: hypothetical protein AAB619_00690, partial [Patescibacteria group bacterium]
IIPEGEMVLEFLQAESKSPRFVARYYDWLGQHAIPVNVNMQTLDPNVRKDLLWSVRPGLFKTLPKDIVWHEVLLEKQDWDRVMYINEDVWKNFSHGTRLVLRGVDKLGLPHHETLTKRVSEITSQLQAGELLLKVIIVAAPGLEKLVLLEGHVRATAYVSSGIYRVKQISAILGISQKATDWAWY